MHTQTLTVVFALFSNLLLNAQTNRILYVRPGSNGNGISWDKAINDLQSALKVAKNNTQIWVAEGIYFPTDGNDRTISFEVPSGVALYGGFAGHEKALSERSFLQHPSILSGNIGSEDADDNTYNVVFTKNASPATVLDGFIVTGGHASGDGISSNRLRSGGGWYNDGSGRGQSSPTIANCTFLDNFAKDGGALYNNAKGGQADPTLKDCYFESNQSDLDGGAVYNDARAGGKCAPLFFDCTFEGNRGNYGGAVFNYGLNGQVSPHFTNCIFSTNNAFVKGGAIFHLAESQFGKEHFGNSIFNNNSALDHGSDDVHNYLITESQMAGK